VATTASFCTRRLLGEVRAGNARNTAFAMSTVRAAASSTEGLDTERLLSPTDDPLARVFETGVASALTDAARRPDSSRLPTRLFRESLRLLLEDTIFWLLAAECFLMVCIWSATASGRTLEHSRHS
jgi:hypothetical protein